MSKDCVNMDGALPREPALSTLLNGEIAKAYKEVCPGFNGGSLIAPFWIPCWKCLWSWKLNLQFKNEPQQKGLDKALLWEFVAEFMKVYPIWNYIIN